MGFLQTIIADAQPRKPMRQVSVGPTPITGRETQDMNRDASVVDEKSPPTPDLTKHFSASIMPDREGISDLSNHNLPLFQTNNLANQNTLDEESYSEQESHHSVPINKSGSLSYKGSHTQQDTDISQNWELNSMEDKASAVAEVVPQQQASILLPDNRMNSPQEKQESVSQVVTTELHGSQYQTPDKTEVETDSAPATIRDTTGSGLTIHNSHTSTLQTEEGAGQVSIDETMTSINKENAPVQGEGIRVTSVEIQHNAEDSNKDQMSGQVIMPGNNKGVKDTEKTLLDDGNSHQPSPGVDEQTKTKSMSNQEDNLQLGKPKVPGEVHRDVQPVSRQSMTSPTHGTPDTEHASTLQSVGKEQPTIANLSNPVLSKHESKAQTTRHSLNSDKLRVVPARSFQTDSMPMEGGNNYSRSQPRIVEKKHEPAKIQIGQIDVIIEAASQPVVKQNPAPSSIDLASRYYLRRL